jgi:phosphate transport system permease protein
VKRQKFRRSLDRSVRSLVFIGGYSVIAAILLIFVFLLLQVWPLMQGADINALEQFQMNPGKTLHVTIEEQAEVASQFLADGQIEFYQINTGKQIESYKIEATAETEISSFSALNDQSGLVGYGFKNGSALVLQQQYKKEFSGAAYQIKPEITYPFGTVPIVIDATGQALKKLAIESNEQTLSVLALSESKKLLLLQKQMQWNGLSVNQSGLLTLTKPDADAVIELDELNTSEQVQHLLINKTQTHATLISSVQNKQWLRFYAIGNKQFRLIQRLQLGDTTAAVSSAAFLTGGTSLLLGRQTGMIEQWFPVNSEDGITRLVKIREFQQQDNPILRIVAEPERKGFAAMDVNGNLGIYYSSSNLNLLQQNIARNTVDHIALSQRANYLLTLTENNQATLWAIDNEHPEASFASLWRAIWYENYDKPDYIWQSSSASNDFEAKFSLAPLVFGTLKAAFYAMLFAAPIAIMGAIYTAYFMNARMRKMVKPTIEIMEALPTVIIGFLAGLWLAPFVDEHVLAILSLIIILPSGIIITAWLWHRLALQHRIYSAFGIALKEGLEALILIPVLILLIALSLAITPYLEQWLFAGDIQYWLSSELELAYDQRNAIIVGIAMGFAVIPTIFTITEDAVFHVPPHLSYGSMALGATRWQTLITVVILTASPAIFSAVMIGFGRAIGETMIVLMATGNTPIMDFNIFQGMRTLSANIAIEIPESEVGSSHYRILFLSALILFIFTFFFNTIAELVRQRLRSNYSNL